MCQILEEFGVKIKDIETKNGKMHEVEFPCVVGEEFNVAYEAAKTQDLLIKCTERGAAVKDALADFENFKMQMEIEAQNFGDDLALEFTQSLGKMLKRTSLVADKLDAFQKELNNRTNEARKMEAPMQRLFTIGYSM